MPVLLFNPRLCWSPCLLSQCNAHIRVTWLVLASSTSGRVTEKRPESTHTGSSASRSLTLLLQRGGALVCQEDNVAAPPFFIKASYICEFIGGSSSGPPQTARLKRGALPPAGQARGQKARYPPPHSLPFCADFQREFLLFCVSQFIVVIFLSSGLTDAQYLNMNRAAAFAVSSWGCERNDIMLVIALSGKITSSRTCFKLGYALV